MISTRQLIFMIFIVFYFVNIATSMEEAGTSSGEPRPRKGFKERTKKTLEAGAGIKQCKKTLHDQEYTESGVENYMNSRLPPDTTQRNFDVIQTTIEATYLLYLDNIDNIPFLGVSRYCEKYWFRNIILGQTRKITQKFSSFTKSLKATIEDTGDML